MNISEHIHTFEQEMKRRNYAANTIEIYTSCLKTFFAWTTKDHPKNINESDIKQFLGQYTTPNTQRGYHSAIKKFYAICLHQPNKFKYIPYCRKDNKLPIVLSVAEVQAMFTACTNLKHKVILAILYSTGLRVSELIDLQWPHIDRSRMIINIIAAKGNKDRQVMLAPQLIPLLEEYYREYKPVQYVLNGQSKPQYTQRSVLAVVKQLAIAAGIHKRVYTHLMRHNTFTHMVEHGTDINLIQKLAGHASVKTTNIYLHTSHNFISQLPSPLAAIKMQ